MPTRRSLSIALFMSIPCLLALAAYDWTAMVILGHGPSRLVPWHDLARAFLQDTGMTLMYTVTITPRVVNTVAGYPEKARRVSLIMLGLGLAWYAEVCAWVTRTVNAAPDLGVSIVLLFVVPVIVAPWYVGWLHDRVPSG